MARCVSRQALTALPPAVPADADDPPEEPGGNERAGFGQREKNRDSDAEPCGAAPAGDGNRRREHLNERALHGHASLPVKTMVVGPVYS